MERALHMKPRAYARPARTGRALARRLLLAAGVALVVGGLAAVAYPFVSDYLEKLDQERFIAAQREAVATVAESDSTALAGELEACRDYNARLAAGELVVDGAIATSSTASEYEERLALAGDGVMATICIPSAGVEVPLYHGTSDEVLQKGAGHLAGSSLPVGGAGTHCVVSGHTGLPSVRIFDDLETLEAGDYFVVQVLDQELAYRVYATEVVDPDDTSSCEIEEGRDLFTLTTCTPYGVNTHRLLVHAERCALPDEWLARGASSGGVLIDLDGEKPLWPYVAVGLCVGAGVLGAGVFLTRKDEKGTVPFSSFSKRRGRHA